MPMAGCDSVTTVLVVQNNAHMTQPACPPMTTMESSSTRLSGWPQAIRSSGRILHRARCGETRPQSQKVVSMARLMPNSPAAACAGVWPPTLTIHGPAHSVCTAIMPP